ncbi:hypothetical protein ASPVEDRAFT_76352 [Aspergillus versicolor CBS 583.65]|uniref:CENP-V/GFA domain-containing protein n=1 Tax=Aspergillus versicolor CBS 583.65 TaxID=1036611 RepID=A0A1L9Q115_ASPVE|nr:uncharacterized protein ASPVEDRAFT_76352 [Aspergillus versicolor CBS 583.65]OJJ07458.1 hypothetical protein ASPVEDRAFT_76352 [Aspergillus versicolor CBS 583.65]
MARYHGHCICGSVRVSLTEEPPNSLVCHCGHCARSGGGASINYMVDESDLTVEENNTLKAFEDTQTASGNPIERRFCGACGSPVFTKTPKYPGKVLLKATLFDHISNPVMEVFTGQRQSWRKPIEGASQL